MLAYLFHRIEARLDGRPDLLIVDEGWLALDDEGFAGQLREWLKTLRKKNASVVFATQSLSDIDGSPIAPAIIESCPTRLFLPNERAIEPQITAIYRRFGLNDRQIEILARATPKRDYYRQSRRGNRLFELGLGEVALAFTAASSKSDQAPDRTHPRRTRPRRASSPAGLPAARRRAGPPTSFPTSAAGGHRHELYPSLRHRAVRPPSSSGAPHCQLPAQMTVFDPSNYVAERC